MDHDFMKRGYLLPEGCKDLIDILVRARQPSPQHPTRFIDASKFKGLIDSGKLKLQLSKFKPTQPFWKPST